MFLPNISVLAPCTERDASEATTAMIANGGVGYLRLDKDSAKDCLSNELLCLDFLGRGRLFPLFGPVGISYLYIHTVDEV